MTDRAGVNSLISSYFPSSGYIRQGMIGFDHIAKDYSTGYGTTCGYLPHWLLWRLGCTDGKLINRYEPDTPFKYRNGKNINNIFAHPAFINLIAVKNNNTRFLEGSIYPKAGDAVIIKGAAANTEHVFVVLDEGSWTDGETGSWHIAQMGQKSSSVEAGHATTCAVKYKNGKWMVGSRWMLGWLDLDRVTFGSQLFRTDPLPGYSQLPSTTAGSMVGVWKVLCDNSSNGWFYMFQKGFRAFWAPLDSPGHLGGGGFWIPQGNSVAIQWDDGSWESMTVNGAKATGKDASGANWKATRKTGTGASAINNYSSSTGSPMS